MAGTPTTFDALVTRKAGNVRKALKGGILYAPMTTAIPAALTALNTDPVPVPVLQSLTGFSSLGFMTTDGATVGRSVDTSAVEGWGEGDPLRTDIIRRTKTLHFTGLETTKSMLAFYHGVDAADLVPDADTGELVIDETGDLETVYYRVLLLGQDGAAGSEYWPAKLLPKASITGYGDQVFMSGDTPIQYDVTVTAYKDDAAGFSMRNVWCGPGWKANLTAAGFA